MDKTGYVLAVIALAVLLVFISYNYSEKITGGAVNAADVKCVDTDNGNDFFLKADVSVGDISKSDFCAVMPDEIAKRKNKIGDVIEYYCKDDKTYDVVAHTCPKGCKDGACIMPTDDVMLLDTIATTDRTLTPCTDSDGGRVYASKGKLYGSVIDPKTAEDECVLFGGKSAVAERYCYSKERGAFEYHDCTKEKKTCENGACVALPPVVESSSLKWAYTVLNDNVITKEPGCTYGGEGNFLPTTQGYVNIASGLTPAQDSYRLYIGKTMMEYCDKDDMTVKWEFYCDSHGYAHIAKIRCDDVCQLGACDMKNS